MVNFNIKKYNTLKAHLQNQDTVTKDDLKKQLFYFLSIVDYRAAENYIRRLTFDNTIKIKEGTNPIEYEIIKKKQGSDEPSE